jgi:hypothetical protein
VESHLSPPVFAKSPGVMCMRWFNDRGVDPKQLATILVAFEAVCHAVGVRGLHDPFAETVALRIIEVAQTGMTDPVQIRETVLRSLRN